MSIDNLRKALKEGKLKTGLEETNKLLKKDKVKEVFVASNCPENWENTLKKYCEITKCKFSKLKENSNEVGAICKKPFSIVVCCYLK